MVDVKTSIHEVKMDILKFDRKNMIACLEKGSDDELHKISYFKPLVENILISSEKILKDGGYEFDKLEITNMWGNKLKEGETHAPHTHSNNFLSGVYYLQSGSPIQFFDPRPASSILKPRNIPDWDNSNMIEFHFLPLKCLVLNLCLCIAVVCGMERYDCSLQQREKYM